MARALLCPVIPTFVDSSSAQKSIHSEASPMRSGTSGSTTNSQSLSAHRRMRIFWYCTTITFPLYNCHRRPRRSAWDPAIHPDTHTHRHTADPKPDLSQRKVGANNHISLTLSTRHRPHKMLGGDEGDSRFFQEDRHIGIQDTTRVDTSPKRWFEHFLGTCFRSPLTFTFVVSDKALSLGQSPTQSERLKRHRSSWRPDFCK